MARNVINAQRLVQIVVDPIDNRIDNLSGNVHTGLLSAL